MYSGRIHIFFREAKSIFPSPHGRNGKVMSTVIEPQTLYNWDNTSKIHPEPIFTSGYEMDAIVSNPAPSIFILCTRTFEETTRKVEVFVSISNTPTFNERKRVTVKGVKKFVFYGKPIYRNGAFLFTAYGLVEWEDKPKPLLICTENFERWELLSYISSIPDHIILNESSMTEHDNRLHMFTRQDNLDFGIWHSKSSDGKKWNSLSKLFPYAHAPTTLKFSNSVWLSYRRIFGKNLAGISIRRAIPNLSAEITIDTYQGNIYDGGYSDTLTVDRGILLFYYRGNNLREPTLNFCYIKEEELEAMEMENRE